MHIYVPTYFCYSFVLFLNSIQCFSFAETTVKDLKWYSSFVYLICFCTSILIGVIHKIGRLFYQVDFSCWYCCWSCIYIIQYKHMHYFLAMVFELWYAYNCRADFCYNLPKFLSLTKSWWSWCRNYLNRIQCL